MVICLIGFAGGGYFNCVFTFELFVVWVFVSLRFGYYLLYLTYAYGIVVLFCVVATTIG